MQIEHWQVKYMYPYFTGCPKVNKLNMEGPYNFTGFTVHISDISDSYSLKFE